MMDYIKVLELKVGDRVGVSGYGWNNLAEIRTVAKRTATQAVLDDGSRWNKYGNRIGEAGYHRQFLMTEKEANERNDEERKRQTRLALIREVRDMVLKDIDDDGLRAILQVAKDHTL